ncbi:DUF6447 family protein [Azonexus sp.]|uniref:DUF6447 family protein n=1 Tax=Azonexus sp. TaxID=1872668 RepID=UPI0027B985D4|nr:DUF6447 family protein [Azonexus sp.]
MAKLTINGKDYDLDGLSENAKAQLASLQFADAEIQRLNAQLAVFNTARNAYLKGLLADLEQGEVVKPKKPARASAKVKKQ